MIEDKTMFECFTNEIDESIRSVIYKINALGYNTFASCSGLWRDHTDEIMEPWDRNAYVAFIADGMFTMDLLFRITRTIWDVEVRDNDLFGDSIVVRLPCVYDGVYITETSVEYAWDELLEVLEKG